MLTIVTKCMVVEELLGYEKLIWIPFWWFNKFAKECVINILLVFHQGQTQGIIVEALLRLTCPHQLEVCLVILLLYVLFLIWSILSTTCVMVDRSQKFNLLIDCSFEFVNFDLNSILWFKNFAKACVMNI